MIQQVRKLFHTSKLNYENLNMIFDEAILLLSKDKG